MHERHTYGCLLGCRDAVDDLSHYLVCPRLWKALKNALSTTHVHIPESLVSASVLAKLALTDPSCDCVLHLCAIAHTYKLFNLSERGNVAEIADISIDVAKASLNKFRAMV